MDVELVPLHTVQEMLPNYGLVKQLTTKLSEADYTAWLARMVPHHYAQVVAKENGETIGLSGFWIGHKLFCGKYLESTTSWWIRPIAPEAWVSFW